MTVGDIQNAQEAVLHAVTKTDTNLSTNICLENPLSPYNNWIGFIFCFVILTKDRENFHEQTLHGL